MTFWKGVVMSIVLCPTCGKEVEVPDIGKRTSAKCKWCGTTVNNDFKNCTTKIKINKPKVIKISQSKEADDVTEDVPTRETLKIEEPTILEKETNSAPVIEDYDDTQIESDNKEPVTPSADIPSHYNEKADVVDVQEDAGSSSHSMPDKEDIINEIDSKTNETVEQSNESKENINTDDLMLNKDGFYDDVLPWGEEKPFSINKVKITEYTVIAVLLIIFAYYLIYHFA